MTNADGPYNHTGTLVARLQGAVDALRATGAEAYPLAKLAGDAWMELESLSRRSIVDPHEVEAMYRDEVERLKQELATMRASCKLAVEAMDAELGRVKNELSAARADALSAATARLSELEAAMQIVRRTVDDSHPVMRELNARYAQHKAVAAGT